MPDNAEVVQISSRRGRRYMQYLLEKYQAEHPEEDPSQVEPRRVAEWAVRRGIYQRPPTKPEDRLRRELARYLKTEYTTDPQGRHVRKHHAVVYYVETAQGLQRRSRWYEIYHAAPEEMQAALQLRRRMAFQDVRQLSLDFESYNDNNVRGGVLEPMDFNFNEDLKESKMPTTYPEDPPSDEEDLEDDHEIN